MPIPLRYILDGSNRVYLDGKEVFTEYRCAFCGGEVPEGQMFMLRAYVSNGTDQLRMDNPDGTAIFLHKVHVISYFCGQAENFLAG